MQTFDVAMISCMSDIPAWADRKEFEERDFRDCRSCLAVRRGDVVEYHWDGGEPEDNTFGRDWAWVAVTIADAYAAGRSDALSGLAAHPNGDPSEPPTAS